MKTRVDLSRLRHPAERPFWVAAVLLNTAIMIFALWAVFRGADAVFDALPFLEGYGGRIRTVVLAVLAIPPALVFQRNRRLAEARSGSVKIGPSQHPLMAARLQSHCDRLGVEEPPQLYVSDQIIHETARAFTAWHREFIVLGTDYLEKDLEPLQDVWSFLLGRELGRLALGHVEWWDELLVAYVDRLPWVRRPLRHVRAYSLDRVGAFLEPEGIRGLVIEASGRRTLPSTNVAEQIRHALSVGGFWLRFTGPVEERPHLALRIQKLYSDGFFDLGHDLERFAAAEINEPPAHVPP